MANWSDPRSTYAGSPTSIGGEAEVHAGLRSYMLSVYNYMAAGVLLTGIVAMLFAGSSFGQNILMNGGPLRWIIVLSPLALVMWMSFGFNRMSLGTLRMVYWAYATVMGLSMSVLFLIYTQTSIAQTFFATAAAFAGLSLWGYITKKDLSGFGTFLIMGLIGLLVASLINIFFQSSTMSLVISVIGVLLFAGLTAYDTQKIKSLYFQVPHGDALGKVVVMGALSLYLDFINMFQFLLRFMGNRN